MNNLYSDSFKAKALKLLATSTMAATSAKMGISVVTLRKWRDRAGHVEATRGPGRPRKEQAVVELVRRRGFPRRQKRVNGGPEKTTAITAALIGTLQRLCKAVELLHEALGIRQMADDPKPTEKALDVTRCEA
jgi:transposase-like protein